MLLRCTLQFVLPLVSLTLFASEGSRLQEVASFPDQQVTGVAVSKEGRVFVNFPYWSSDHTVSVSEVMKDGTAIPASVLSASKVFTSTSRMRFGSSTQPPPCSTRSSRTARSS